MKTHPGALTSTPSKAQSNDAAEDHISHSANKKLGKQEEKQGLVKSPEKGDSKDPRPIGVASNAGDQPMDTSV